MNCSNGSSGLVHNGFPCLGALLFVSLRGFDDIFREFAVIEGLHLLPRMPREGARDYALRLLKYNIACLHLPPGTMISAADLAEATTISRTPFREAMQELAQSGILHIFPQAGSQVSFIDYNRIHEARFIRLALETAVTVEACDAINPNACLLLEEILYQQENSLNRGDFDTLLEHDDRFHQTIFRLVNKEYTYQVMSGVLIHFDRIRRLSLAILPKIRVVEDHRNIFDALCRRDKDSVHHYVHEHLSRYYEEEQAIRRVFPQYFEDPGR
jgi:DNA-binding GntR family transcriptional regulator